MSMKFTGIGLLSKEVQKVAQFYRDVLGAKIETSNIHCVVTIDSFSFAIYNPHLHEDSDPLFRSFGQGSLWLDFEVADVDAEYDRIAELNVGHLVPPHNTPFGRRVVFLEDPDGNKIVLHQSQ